MGIEPRCVVSLSDPYSNLLCLRIGCHKTDQESGEKAVTYSSGEKHPLKGLYGAIRKSLVSCAQISMVFTPWSLLYDVNFSV